MWGKARRKLGTSEEHIGARVPRVVWTNAENSMEARTDGSDRHLGERRYERHERREKPRAGCGRAGARGGADTCPTYSSV